MTDLIVLVGLSASGKSTLAEQTCASYSAFLRIPGDRVSRRTRYLFDVGHFSNTNDELWGRLETLGNTEVARFWLYLLMLQQVRTPFAILDSYTLLKASERLILEQAVRRVFPDAQTTYVLVRPGDEDFNLFREKRGQSRWSESRIQKAYDELDLGFAAHTVRTFAELEAVLKALPGFDASAMDSPSGHTRTGAIEIPLLTDEEFGKHDVRYVTRSNGSIIRRWIDGLPLVKRLTKTTKRRFS